MLHPMMHGTYRRNQSLANAKWGDLTPEPAAPIHRKPIESKTNNHESSKIRPKWIQNEKDIERVSSLLMIGTAIHIRNQRKIISDQEKQFLPLRVKSMGSISRSAIRKSKSSTSSDKLLKWDKQIKECKALLREHSYGRIPMAFSQDEDLGKWSKRQRHNHMVHLKNQRRSQLKLNAVFGSEEPEQAKRTPSELCLQGLQLLKRAPTSNMNWNDTVPKEIVLVPHEEPIATLEDDRESETTTRVLG